MDADERRWRKVKRRGRGGAEVRRERFSSYGQFSYRYLHLLRDFSASLRALRLSFLIFVPFVTVLFQTAEMAPFFIRVQSVALLSTLVSFGGFSRVGAK